MEKVARIVGWLALCLFTGVALVIAQIPQANEMWTDQRRALATLGGLAIAAGLIPLLIEVYLLIRPRWGRWRNRPLLKITGMRSQMKPFSVGGINPVENEYVLVKVENRATRSLADAEIVTGQLFVLDSKGAELQRWRGHWDDPTAHSQGDRLTLAAGTSGDLDVVWKNPEEETAFGLSRAAMDRYSSTWADPDLALPPGRYRIRVQVDYKGCSKPIEKQFELTNRGAGWLMIGNTLRAPAQTARATGEAFPQDPEMHEALEAVTTRASAKPGGNEANWKTDGKAQRSIEIGFRPRALRFYSPVHKTVTTLPDEIPVGSGRVLITRFWDRGFMVDEVGTIGDVVSYEPYPEDQIIAAPHGLASSFAYAIAWKLDAREHAVDLLIRNDDVEGVFRIDLVAIEGTDGLDRLPFHLKWAGHDTTEQRLNRGQVGRVELIKFDATNVALSAFHYPDAPVFIVPGYPGFGPAPSDAFGDERMRMPYELRLTLCVFRDEPHASKEERVAYVAFDLVGGVTATGFIGDASKAHPW